MKILSYVQARERVGEGLSEEQARTILIVSGRAEEWVGRVGTVVKKRRAKISEIEVVEQSGLGREILRQVPRGEWVCLVNPSLAQEGDWVVRENLIAAGEIFAKSLRTWLLAQELGQQYLLTDKQFTAEEAKAMRLLWERQESLVAREDIASAMWGEGEYSDWGLDALVCRVRRKLSAKWELITVKGRGYMLVRGERPTRSLSLILGKEDLVVAIPASIYPSDEYLRYMNDKTRPRKVYADLIEAYDHEIGKRGEWERVLCINSYSYDNVDAITRWLPKAKIYFVHYDPRAVKLHTERARELGVEKRVEGLTDDMRESKLKSEYFDLVINDFGLNFNLGHGQNMKMMLAGVRVLKPGGVTLISTVVDARYEGLRYGEDQEKAPINKKNPGIFQADEHLVRKCYTVPYYRQLFEKAGLGEVVEFDMRAGKEWDLPYRRWMGRRG